MIKVNDIIEILKYVYMDILLLIPYCYLSLKSIWYCFILKTNGIELYTNTHVLKRDVYDVMYMFICTHAIIVEYS